MIFLEEIGPKLDVHNEEEEKVQSPVSYYYFLANFAKQQYVQAKALLQDWNCS